MAKHFAWISKETYRSTFYVWCQGCGTQAGHDGLVDVRPSRKEANAVVRVHNSSRN